MPEKEKERKQSIFFSKNDGEGASNDDKVPSPLYQKTLSHFHKSRQATMPTHASSNIASNSGKYKIKILQVIR